VVRRGDRRLGAPVEGWPNSMWMIDLPSAFIWWARRLMAMAWKGSISEAAMQRN
jgi:hypothetical protein